MSRYFYERGRMPEHQSGVKRTYASREHSSHSVNHVSSGVLYSNGWIPPGIAVKRSASPSIDYAALAKMPRMSSVRSFSTSSSVASSSSSSSPSLTIHAHSNSTRSVAPSKRAMSSSEVETRTRDADPKSSVKAHAQSETAKSKGKHKQSDSDSPSNSRVANDSVEKPKDSATKKKAKKDAEESTTSCDSVPGTSDSSKNKLDPKISDALSRKIWAYYLQNKQTRGEEHVKEDLRVKLQAYIREIYPYSLLILGGSSLNGFGSSGCDADLCLYLSESQISQQDCRHILVQLRGHFQRRCPFISNVKVIFAKVPILKFAHRYRELEFDLNINHHTGVRNTLLMQMYSKLDWRVAPLVMLIKQWAKNHGINDASQGTLSSYSYVLMIINYLQVGCKPPVLSSVQAADWGRNLFLEHGGQLLACWKKLYDPTLPLASNKSDNAQDLYSLLKGFFTYYANFEFDTTVISIRLGSCFPRSLLPLNHHGWKQKFIFIEEPFDQVNTARSVFDWSRFRQIQDTFGETHQTLCKADDLDLELFLNLR